MKYTLNVIRKSTAVNANKYSPSCARNDLFLKADAKE